MAAQLSQLGEFGLIQKIAKGMPLSGSVRLGIGDDAAVVEHKPGRKGLLTTDMLVEGVHFLKTMPPALIGRKALAVSISDIAAMGGVPRHALVSLGVSSQTEITYVAKIYQGLRQIARAFNVDIVGGDTVRSKTLVLNVALTGEVRARDLVTRSQARPGDHIYVTGPLGNAYASGHHLRFTPRLKQAQYLVRHCKPSAMIDISDGLASDLRHVLEASHVSGLLDREAIPLRAGAKLSNALNDGEDFELLFTLSKAKARKLHQAKTRFPFWQIGEIGPGKSAGAVIFTDGKTKPLPGQGYTHF